jgi:hypothetical protein
LSAPLNTQLPSRYKDFLFHLGFYFNIFTDFLIPLGSYYFVDIYATLSAPIPRRITGTYANLVMFLHNIHTTSKKEHHKCEGPSNTARLSRGFDLALDLTPYGTPALPMETWTQILGYIYEAYPSKAWSELRRVCATFRAIVERMFMRDLLSQLTLEAGTFQYSHKVDRYVDAAYRYCVV